MRSGTSFFDWTVFKKTVCRFWPLWGAYFAIWLVVLPLNGLMLLRLDSYGLDDFGSYMETFSFERVPQAASGGGLALAVAFGALAAMTVFSHLYNARSANLFGSLPIRREGLFLTHYLAGLAFLIVPNAAIVLLTLLVEAAGGTVFWQGLGFWLAVMCGEGFFFYSLAVFCGLFTGHILALPAFYAIVNCIVFGVTELLHIVLQAFYYGFAGFTEEVYDVVKWFTPVVKLDEAVTAGFTGITVPKEELSSGDLALIAQRGGIWVSDTRYGYLTLEGLGTVGAYALAALALTACAFLLYRARHLESAGDVVSVKVMRPVFKYGMAFCVGLVFGMATVFFTGGGEVALMISILVWGIIGYFAAQMLLDKSFRVFQKWRGALAVSAVFAVLFLVVAFDLTGFETRIPDPARVDSVYASGINAAYLADYGDDFAQDVTDPEVIRLLTILHREAVEQRDEERQTQAQLGISLRLNYSLKGGGSLARRYTVWLNPDEVGREDTAAWAVQQIYDNRELYWQVYGFDRLEESLAEGRPLKYVSYEGSDEEDREWITAVYSGRDALTLLSAVKEDFFAGRIGVRRVDDRENWQGGRPEKSLQFVIELMSGEGQFVRIALQDTASSTLAALDEMAGRAAGPDTDTVME